MERNWNERIRLMSLAACMLTLVSANAQHVTVDGLKYFLYPDTHEAVIDNENTWEGELVLPSEISYNGEAFTVNGMAFSAFADCKKLTKVIIPKSIDHVVNHVLTDDPHVTGAVSNEFMNPFVGCTALESIEVDEDNPSWKSIGGVLFSKDGTGLYCYPAGIRARSYVVPNGVILVGGGTFSFNEHLVSVELPATVNRIYGGVFANCIKLEKVNLPENLTILGARMFCNCI